MSAFSKDLADAIYNHVLRNTAFTSPVTVYLALHASGGSDPAHPGKDSAGAAASEVDYSAYERQVIEFGEPGGSEIADGSHTNTIAFPEVDQGTPAFDVTGVSLWTAETGGTYLMGAPIDLVKDFTEGDSPLFSVGSIEASFGQAL